MTRVFVGIPFSKEVQREVRAWQDSHGIFPVRWISAKNLHVTLIPPWNEENPARILQFLATLTGTLPAFSLEFTGTSFGPRPRAPRLIWAFGEPPLEAIDLLRSAHQALRLPPPKREFLLHATLARFRPEDFARFPVKQFYEPISWTMPVESVVLLESQLGAGGAEYNVLGEIPL